MPVNLDLLGLPAPPGITPFQALVRDLDWSKTNLGSLQKWPRELRQTVRFMLTVSTPVVIFWGESHTTIYNEAFVLLIREKHPHMLGRHVQDVFPEIWAFIENILLQQREDGLAISGRSSRLLMAREGIMEETYFDWNLTPIIGDDGTFLGTYGSPSDSTVHIISERRAACVQELTQRIAGSSSFDDLWSATIAGLLTNVTDVPFAMILIDEEALRVHNSTDDVSKSPGYRVADTSGVPADHMLTKFVAKFEDTDSQLAVAVQNAVTQSKIKILTDEDRQTAILLRDLGHVDGAACRQLAIVPVLTASAKVPTVLIVGINPHRRYNTLYEEFLWHVADVIASQISKLRISAELQYRAGISRQFHRALKESETRFALFTSRAPIGLAVADTAGKILFANDFWCRFSGIEQAMIDENFNWRATIMEDDREMLDEFWHKATVLKEPVAFTYRSKVPFTSGEKYLPNRTAWAACYADLNEYGEVETIMGLIIDISEQKWGEQQLLKRSDELQVSEQRYRNFTDLCPFGIVSTDVDGYVQIGNDAWHDFYGFTKGQVFAPEPWLALVLDEDFQKTKDYFRRLQTTRGPHSVELRLKRRYTVVEGDRTMDNDGWVLATGMQDYNADGSINHIDFWVVDISAQKMGEKILTDKMVEAIRTRTRQERFFDMISHEIRNPLSAVLHSGEDIVDSLKGCMVLLDDSTSRSGQRRRSSISKKIEQLISTSLESASTILYCVHHQKQIVDDVLTLSRLDSELLTVSPVPVKYSDLMSSAVRIFEPELRMAKIEIETINHYSIKDFGIEWILLDPNRYLQILINLISNAIEFTKTSGIRKIVVTSSVHTEPPRQVDKMEYVPRQYSESDRNPPNDQANERVNAGDSEKQIYLRVSVSDSGKGLDPQEKSRLFDRFAQASPKTEVEYGGTGLGLFVSRQITELLGGEIGIGASPSGGCIFAFYVAIKKTKVSEISQTYKAPLPGPQSFSTPRATSAPAQQSWKSREKASLHSTTPISGERRKVLVVEDNVINQKVLCKQLKNRGFEVVASNHGKEALAALENAQEYSHPYFDVVLCDIEMPVMNGIECVREIRAREEAGRFRVRIPVLGVTANVRSKQVDDAMESGMDGVTTKPYRMDDLIAHMDRICGRPRD